MLNPYWVASRYELTPVCARKVRGGYRVGIYMYIGYIYVYHYTL
jgi:hypothetical protein